MEKYTPSSECLNWLDNRVMQSFSLSLTKAVLQTVMAKKVALSNLCYLKKKERIQNLPYKMLGQYWQFICGLPVHVHVHVLCRYHTCMQSMQTNRPYNQTTYHAPSLQISKLICKLIQFITKLQNCTSLWTRTFVCCSTTLVNALTNGSFTYQSVNDITSHVLLI